MADTKCATQKGGIPPFWQTPHTNLGTYDILGWWALSEPWPYIELGTNFTATGMVMLAYPDEGHNTIFIYPDDRAVVAPPKEVIQGNVPGEGTSERDALYTKMFAGIGYEVCKVVDPDPDPDPDVPKFTEEAKRVAAMLGEPLYAEDGKTPNPDSYPLHAMAEQVVPIITAMAQSYTRGEGFADGQPNDEIAAVITTASARMVSNPTQLEQYQGMGPFTGRVTGFDGWTLAETFVLNRYRKKATG